MDVALVPIGLAVHELIIIRIGGILLRTAVIIGRLPVQLQHGAFQDSGEVLQRKMGVDAIDIRRGQVQGSLGQNHRTVSAAAGSAAAALALPAFLRR